MNSMQLLGAGWMNAWQQHRQGKRACTGRQHIASQLCINLEWLLGVNILGRGAVSQHRQHIHGGRGAKGLRS